MIKKIVYLILINVLLFVLSCTQVPDKIISPALRFTLEKKSKTCGIEFSGGIQNSNESCVFKDLNGTVIIKLQSEGSVDLEIPFSVDYVLPFSTGIINASKKMSIEEFNTLSQALNIKPEDIGKKGYADVLDFPEGSVVLGPLKYSKKDIIEFLNEKNKRKNQ